MFVCVHQPTWLLCIQYLPLRLRNSGTSTLLPGVLHLLALCCHILCDKCLCMCGTLLVFLLLCISYIHCSVFCEPFWKWCLCYYRTVAVSVAVFSCCCCLSVFSKFLLGSVGYCYFFLCFVLWGFGVEFIRSWAYCTPFCYCLLTHCSLVLLRVVG